MEEQTVTAKCRKTMSTYQLCVTALMTAVMCILGPMSIPIGEVPITFTNLVIFLAVFLLGTKMGTISCIIYMLLGTAGLPVFSGYTGGIGKLAGPTGGYLAGFIFMALISGYIMEKFSYHPAWCVTGMILGVAALYLFGTAWFVLLTQCTPAYAAAVCVLPFIFGDLAKIVIAVLAGRKVRARLIQAGLIMQ